MAEQQLSLFGDDDLINKRVVRASGGSGNPIIFRDYESYIAKFADKEKTTDDTFTPPDVYDAVVKYVSSIYDMEGKVILRPFYPGGDYENAEYPENGVVIDNPPFSLFTKICAFYTAHNIPFFIFGPGLFITNACKFCTAIIINNSITFENGAQVPCNFASNLFGDTLVMTAPVLNRLIGNCESQRKKAASKAVYTYKWPMELLSVSDLSIFAREGIDFSVQRDEGLFVRTLDNFPRTSGFFGPHILISEAKAMEKEECERKAHRNVPVPLSPREQKIVERLGTKSK